MPDLLLIDFETTGLERRVPLQVFAKLLRWDNRTLETLGEYGDFFHCEIPMGDWPALEFHRKTGFEKRWVHSHAVNVEDMEAALCDLLSLSVSQGPPMICARNVQFELGILREYAPKVIEMLHEYRFIDMTTLSLHPDLNQVHRDLCANMAIHHADEDVELEHTLLLEFLSMV